MPGPHARRARRLALSFAAAATAYAATTMLAALGTPAWAEPSDAVDQPTPRGYLGGLPFGVDVPPTVTLSLSTQGQAVVEGMAVDADGKPCPGYTDLAVSPPAIVEVFTVPVAIDACGLQVHPVTAG